MTTEGVAVSSVAVVGVSSALFGGSGERDA